MSDISIPPGMWKNFLKTFGERHAGWLVQVETHDSKTDETVVSQLSALHSLELDLEDEKNPRINVIVPDMTDGRMMGLATIWIILILVLIVSAIVSIGRSVRLKRGSERDKAA